MRGDQIGLGDGAMVLAVPSKAKSDQVCVWLLSNSVFYGGQGKQRMLRIGPKYEVLHLTISCQTST